MRRPLLLAAAAPLLLLAACSGDAPQPAPSDNGAELMDVTDEAANVLEAPTATPTPEPTPTPEETPSPVPPDEQVQADAEATGMTARVNRDETAPTDEEVDPVPVEKK